MEIGASPLFRGISEESQQAMRTCFDMREVSFRADEVVYLSLIHISEPTRPY